MKDDPASPAHAAAHVIALYQDNAPAWVAARGQSLFERPWLDRFLALVQTGGAQVLDLGCGAGQPIAGYMSARGCHVTGVDGAAALIDMARENFPAHEWIAADMRDLPPLGKFNGVIAWHSFFHLTPEDQRPMFKTFSRLCHPGADLMFTSGTSLGDQIGEFAGQALYHGSLDPADYRGLLQENGFELVAHAKEDQSCGGATVWLAQKVA